MVIKQQFGLFYRPFFYYVMHLVLCRFKLEKIRVWIRLVVNVFYYLHYAFRMKCKTLLAAVLVCYVTILYALLYSHVSNVLSRIKASSDVLKRLESLQNAVSKAEQKAATDPKPKPPPPPPPPCPPPPPPPPHIKKPPKSKTTISTPAVSVTYFRPSTTNTGKRGN